MHKSIPNIAISNTIPPTQIDMMIIPEINGNRNRVKPFISIMYKTYDVDNQTNDILSSLVYEISYEHIKTCLMS